MQIGFRVSQMRKRFEGLADAKGNAWPNGVQHWTLLDLFFAWEKTSFLYDDTVPAGLQVMLLSMAEVPGTHTGTDLILADTAVHHLFLSTAGMPTAMLRFGVHWHNRSNP